MNDLAVAREVGRLDQFVVPVDLDRLRRLVEQRLDEGVEVARVERRGACRDAAGNVGMADDLDAVCFHHLPCPRPFHVAAALYHQFIVKDNLLRRIMIRRFED